MTSEGLGETFEGDSADTCAGKFPLTSIRGRAEGLACKDTEARTPIGVSRNFSFVFKSTYPKVVDWKYLCNKFYFIHWSVEMSNIFYFKIESWKSAI